MERWDKLNSYNTSYSIAYNRAKLSGGGYQMHFRGEAALEGQVGMEETPQTLQICGSRCQ